jgi:hypothetical protein
MARLRELIKEGDKEKLWKRCCGFIDLTLDEFMEIQKRLLIEQISLYKNSKIGQKIMRGASPATIEEFRRIVPLTTYEDYCPELLEKQEDTLPAKVVRWTHTSGKSGTYRYKWMPITEGVWEEMANQMYAASIFAICHKRGEIPALPSKFLYATAIAPYTTGVIAYQLEEEFGYKFFPPLDESGNLTFLDRLEKGIQMALSEGIDGIYGFTNILVAIGERIKNGGGNVKVSFFLRNPGGLMRVTKALIKSRLAGRPLLPKDLWKLKGMVCGGADSVIFRHRIKDMWGVQPLDIYASTEALIVAMQTWDYEGMTFNPSMNFLEFIPESEYYKWKEKDAYEMKTVLLDQVEVGGIYELVITTLHGGPLARYRTGDMIKIESLRNEKLDIDIPQMTFHRRADDVIFLGNLFRLTETVIWRAIENADIGYVDWVANKEVYEGYPVLRVYLELKDNTAPDIGKIERDIYEEIKKLDDGFIHNVKDIGSMEKLMNLHPVRVTLLPVGAFSNYSRRKQASGADLAQLKPPRINPSAEVLALLSSDVTDDIDLVTVCNN